MEAGRSIDLLVSLSLSPDMLPGLGGANGNPEALVLLVTSERCFDHAGCLRLPSDERMSTLLTPSGIAIEGGSSGAVSQALGGYRNPIDQLASLPAASLSHDASGTHALFHLRITLPADISPGIYRLRCDFGIRPEGAVSACARALPLRDAAVIGSTRRAPTRLRYPYPEGMSPVRRLMPHGSGPRTYAVLLAQYNSNGSRGVVAIEDASGFALSNRNIIPDETVLPLFECAGRAGGLQPGAAVCRRFHRPAPKHPLGLWIRRTLRAR